MYSTDCLKKICETRSGLSLSLTIAAAVAVLELLPPVRLTGISVIALFLGMLLSYFQRSVPAAQVGARFTSRKILKLAIILLGVSPSIQTILHVDRYSLVVMCFMLPTRFGGSYFVGKALGLNWELPNLTSAGTGTCGGSAITATTPTVNARDRDVTYTIPATFLFDMAMILLLPVIGRAIGLSDMVYGLWSGTAVNDASSIMAVGYAFSEATGGFATMVKLTRTLSIIPTVIIFALVEVRLKCKEAAATGLNGDIRVNIKFSSLFPWFILGSLILAFMNSLGFTSPSLSLALKEMSRFLVIASLGAVGLNTSLKKMYQSGAVPMLHGFIISTLVVIVAVGVEYSMGII